MSTGPVASTRRGVSAGLAFAVCEAALSILLLPMIDARLGAEASAAWVVLSSSAALVGLAGAAYLQPLTRSIVALQRVGRLALPGNWAALIGQLAIRICALLALFQLVFVAAQPQREAWIEQFGVGGVLALFASQHLRLLALSVFTAFNGLALLGRDKSFQAWASLSAFTSGTVLLCVGGGLGGLALVLLMGQAALLAAAWWSAGSLFQDRTLVLALPSMRQSLALLTLGLAGYLNLSTDVLLAARFMTPAQMLEYGVLSRTLALSLAAVGLWVHVRYPQWCDPRLLVHSAARELRVLGAGVTLLVAALALVLHVWRGLQQPSGAPPDVLPLLTLHNLLACWSIVQGQYLLARARHGFVWPAAGVAAMAPGLAWLIGAELGGVGFLWGYVLSNALLCLVHGFFLCRPTGDLQRQARRRTE